MLPVDAHNTPLCLLPAWSASPHAWPKLWKHHGAGNQALELTAAARNEAWLSRYGGHIGLEWLLPKMLQTYDEDTAVTEAASAWVEAGDWFVAQLCGHSADDMVRSTCQAGYKACWSEKDGLPSEAYLNSVRPHFGGYVHDKLTTREYVPPGRAAGQFSRRCPWRN